MSKYEVRFIKSSIIDEVEADNITSSDSNYVLKDKDGYVVAVYNRDLVSRIYNTEKVTVDK